MKVVFGELLAPVRGASDKGFMTMKRIKYLCGGGYGY
jgi:hypothetical protein